MVLAGWALLLAQDSWVPLENAELRGQAVRFDAQGGLLAPASWIVSPHPFRSGLRSARLVGLHPRFDLALVRIDLASDPLPEPPLLVRGDAVQVDVPGGASIRTTVVRVHEGVVELAEGTASWAIVRPVGGPPAAVVVVLKTAVPLRDLRSFVAPPGRPRRPVEAAAWRNRGDHRRAMVEDLDDPEGPFRRGEELLKVGRADLAWPYLLRAARLRPWAEPSGEPFVSLGWALAATGKREAAVALWREVVSKHPTGAAEARLALAKVDAEAGDLAAAAREKAEVEALAGCCRAGKDFLTEAGERAFRELTEDLRRAGVFDLDLASPSKVEAPASDVEVLRAFHAGRLRVAKEFIAAGRKEQARSILNDLLGSRPDEVADEAARLLQEICP